MKFRKKPVVIEALKLGWSNWNEMCDFVPKPWFVRGCYIDAEGKELPQEGTPKTSERMGLILKTLESQEFLAQQGDWIIKGVKGEFYACKPDIFEATYEPVEPS